MAGARAYLVCGLSETLTCAALRDGPLKDGKENVLCLYGRPISMPPALVTETLREAARFGPWAEVIDLVPLTAPAEQALKAGDPTALDAIKARLGDLSIDEFVTHSPQRTFEGGVVAAYPDASIVFFDNGFASHFDFSTHEAGYRPDADGAISKALLQRIRCAWFAFGGALPYPAPLTERPCAPIDPTLLREAARKAIAAGGATAIRRLSAPARLVLGTSFYRVGRAGYDAERARCARSRMILSSTRSIPAPRVRPCSPKMTVWT